MCRLHESCPLKRPLLGIAILSPKPYTLFPLCFLKDPANQLSNLFTTGGSMTPASPLYAASPLTYPPALSPALPEAAPSPVEDTRRESASSAIDSSPPTRSTSETALLSTHVSSPELTELCHAISQASLLETPDPVLKALYATCDAFLEKRLNFQLAGDEATHPPSLLPSLEETMARVSREKLQLGYVQAAMAYCLRTMSSRLVCEIISRGFPLLEVPEDVGPPPLDRCSDEDVRDNLEHWVGALQVASRSISVGWSNNPMILPDTPSQDSYPRGLKDILGVLRTLIAAAFPMNDLARYSTSAHPGFHLTDPLVYERFLTREALDSFRAKYFETTLLKRLDKTTEECEMRVLYQSFFSPSTHRHVPALLQTCLQGARQACSSETLNHTASEVIDEALEHAALAIQKELIYFVFSSLNDGSFSKKLSSILGTLLPYCPAVATALSMPHIRERLRLRLLDTTRRLRASAQQSTTASPYISQIESILSKMSHASASPNRLLQTLQVSWMDQFLLLKKVPPTDNYPSLFSKLHHLLNRLPPSQTVFRGDVLLLKTLDMVEAPIIRISFPPAEPLQATSPTSSEWLSQRP